MRIKILTGILIGFKRLNEKIRFKQNGVLHPLGSETKKNDLINQNF